MKVQWVKPWKFSGCHSRAPLSVIFPIQCNNDYYSEPSGWVKRSYVRIAMAFVSALCLSSTEGKSDAPTHLSFGSRFLFYSVCYYGSVSYFLSWSNWIGFILSILIKLKRSYFEVQTKQLFDSSVYWSLLNWTYVVCIFVIITIWFQEQGTLDSYHSAALAA